VFQLGSEKYRVGKWRALLHVKDIFEGILFEISFLFNFGIYLIFMKWSL